MPTRNQACQHAPTNFHEAHLERLIIADQRSHDAEAVDKAVLQARKRVKMGEDRIGFPSDDKRPTMKANRAGTRGFRAPEVLFKCPDQTFGRLDVAAAGRSKGHMLRK